ncbi:MAG: type II toxin-antitoxin system RelE/ParE family toxin [Pseudomonadales bacterium]|nr:type II toxin-antitoxin system RelE/ParE family toxin [Pseudomonadales bacterium]
MIKTFKHKGLKAFFQTSSTKGIQASHSKKLSILLAALNTAEVIEDMDIPSYRLHELTGQRKETWSVSVNGNWRMTFEFEDGDAYIVNYEDYH